MYRGGAVSFGPPDGVTMLAQDDANNKKVQNQNKV